MSMPVCIFPSGFALLAEAIAQLAEAYGIRLGFSSKTDEALNPPFLVRDAMLFRCTLSVGATYPCAASAIPVEPSKALWSTVGPARPASTMLVKLRSRGFIYNDA